MAHQIKRQWSWIALSLFLLVSVYIANTEARWWAMQGNAATSSEPSGAWDISTWDQATETADPNVHMMVVAGGAGTNETGLNVVTGTDLVYTQVGTVAGVSGGLRALNGTDQCFTMVPALRNVIANQDVWGLMFRGTIDEASLFSQWYSNTSGSYTNQLNIRFDTAQKLRVQVGVLGGNNKMDATTTDALSSATEYFIWIGCDGVNNVSAAFKPVSEGVPTKWTDFAADKRIQGSAVAKFTAAGFDNNADNYNAIFRSDTSYCTGSLRWFILARNTTIIDMNT